MIVKKAMAVVLAGLVAFPALAQERQEEVQRTPAGKIANQLKIFVLQGEGAVNSIKDRVVTPPVVEVRDAFNQPVQGAEVQFQLPMAGAGGFFAGRQLGWTGRTDANGQVVASGLVPNDTPGRFNIRVSARHGESSGSAVVAQSNSLRPVDLEMPRKRVSGWWKALAVAGAGAAAGGIVWGLRRNNNEIPTVVLQPGTISFGGPR